jgi:hypothetical protein
MPRQEARVAWLRTHAGAPAAKRVDRSPGDWYAESSSCGLPPGECRQHPRGPLSQRPPQGDWRVWGYEQVFGSRFVARWPRHLVLAGLETLDLLLESRNLVIHSRCTRLKDAFQTYSRQRRGGEWIDYPADSHPEEDMIDALRGGIRDAFPEGLAPRPSLHPVHASRVLG